MIKINENDSILDIIGKIKESKDFNIVLEFPFGNPILHNYLSLKLIKSKAGKKDVIIVTNDLSSKKIGKPLGIKYSIVNDEKFIKQENLLKHNFTFFEYLKFELNRYRKDFKSTLKKNKKINDLKNYKEKYLNQKSGISFFLISLLVSSVMLVFIFYFAVNKSYIYIIPEITIKTRSKNIIFREKEEESAIETNNNIVAIQKISKLVNLEQSFKTTGVKEELVKKSYGNVKIFNKTSENIKLLDKTKLITKDGLLYETNNVVDIPAGKIDEKGIIIPGETEVQIRSKVYDENGVFIGKNGNISSGTLLNFPKLDENLKSDIYGITTTDFKGGGNEAERFLSNDDLIYSEKLFEGKLREKAIKELRDEIKEKNKNSNIVFEMLDFQDAVNYSNLDIKKVGNINIGDKIDKFSISGNINIEAYIYNKNSLISKMKQVINDSILSGIEKIDSINEKSLRMVNIIYKQQNPLEFKVSVELDAFILHVFGNDGDDYYIQRLKNSILGLNKDEAEKILLNDPQISHVNIDIKPFFINKLPNIPENIIFKIQE